MNKNSLFMCMIRCFVLITFLFFSGSLNAQFFMGSPHEEKLERAYQLIQSRDYMKAVQIIRPLAEKGDPGAQYLAATLFLNGYGVTKSEAQGIKYARLASEKGQMDAVKLLSDFYDKKGEYKKSFELLNSYKNKRFESFQDSARASYVEFGEGAYRIGLYYLTGKGTNIDEDKGWAIMKESFEGRNYIKEHKDKYYSYRCKSENCTTIEELVEKKFANEVDFDLLNDLFDTKQSFKGGAKAYFKEQAKKGDALSIALVSWMEFGLGNIKEAKILAKKSAQKSNVGKVFANYLSGLRYIGEEFEEGVVFLTDKWRKNAKIMTREFRKTNEWDKNWDKELKEKYPEFRWREPRKYEYDAINRYYEDVLKQYLPDGNWWATYTNLFYKTGFGFYGEESSFRRKLSGKGYSFRIAEYERDNIWYPTNYRTTSNKFFTVDNVIIKDGMTYVTMLYTNGFKNYSFVLHPDIYLETKGVRYKLQDSQYKLNEPIKISDLEEVRTFTLVFDAIPTDWSSFDIIDENPNCFKIYGIQRPK